MVSGSQKAQTSSFVSPSSTPSSVSMPPGFRFDPTNEELVAFYLLSKNNGAPLPCDAIQDFDLYGKMEPWEIWDLHSSSSRPDGKDLFFFTQLKRVCSNGSKIMRSVGTGTWFNNRSYSYQLKLEGGGCVRWRLTRFHYEARKEELKKYNRAWLMEELSLEYPMGKHVLCRLRKNAKKNNTEQAGSRTRKSTNKRKADEEEERQSESFIHEPKRMKVGGAEAENVNQVQRLAPEVEVEEVEDDLQEFVEQVNASLEEVSDKEKSTREEDVRQPVPPPGDDEDDDALNASIDFSELDLDFDYLLSDEFVGATSETTEGNFLFDDGFLNSIPEIAGGVHQSPTSSKQMQPSTLILSH